MTGAELRAIASPAPLWQLAFSRSGALIATSSDHHVWLRDAAWRPLADFEVAAGQLCALAVDDFARLVTGHEDGTVRFRRAGHLLATAAGHTAHVRDVELRGNTVLSASWDLTLRAWPFPAAAQPASSSPASAPLHRFDRLAGNIAISPSHHLLATADGSPTISLWDAAQHRLLLQLPTASPLAHLAFLDDTHLLAGGTSGHLELLDLSLAIPSTATLLARLTAGAR